MIDLKNFLNEDQDPKAVEKLAGKLQGILMRDETVEYIAVQKKPAVNISPDCIALTNKRVIFCRPKNLGFSMDFEDCIWKDVVDCHLKEGILGAEITIRTLKGMNKMDYLPKAQARKLYTIAQEQEEIQRDYRRQRDLEDKRAAAGGGVVVTANIPAQNPTQIESKQDDPLAVLQKLKALLDNGLISQDEYNSKKTEVLSRL